MLANVLKVNDAELPRLAWMLMSPQIQDDRRLMRRMALRIDGIVRLKHDA